MNVHPDDDDDDDDDDEEEEEEEEEDLSLAAFFSLVVLAMFTALLCLVRHYLIASILVYPFGFHL